MKTVLSMLVLLAASVGSSETIYTNEKPASPLKVLDAAKLTTPFYRCRQVTMGKNLSPVAKPGTENTFHAAAPKEIENALDLLTDGKSIVYKCETVEFNKEKMKIARIK